MADEPRASPDTLPDRRVIAARTDRNAFDELFDQFYPVIFRYCLRRLVIRATAEDVTAEVFLKVAGGLHGFSGTTEEDFRRWLYRIATNEINAWLRKAARRRELLEAAARMGAVGANGDENVATEFDEIDWQDVYAALDDLPERERSIISLRFFAGLQHSQIATALETTSGAVRVAMSRALDKLRDRLRSAKSQPSPDRRRT